MDAAQASRPEGLTDPANNLGPNKGKLWRFVATVGAWLQALDYTSFDYTQDRKSCVRAGCLALVTLHPNDECYSRVPK